MGTRPTKEESYLETAAVWARQSTCLKRQVGAVLVKDGHVISTGFNGAPSGWEHCSDEGVGCYLVDGSCERSIHAEENAILQAAMHGHSVKGAVLYCTLEPCFRCRMRLAACGVTDLHWKQDHRRRHDIQHLPVAGEAVS